LSATMLRDIRNAVQQNLSAKLASRRCYAKGISSDVEAISDIRETKFCGKISSTAQREDNIPVRKLSALRTDDGDGSSNRGRESMMRLRFAISRASRIVVLSALANSLVWAQGQAVVINSSATKVIFDEDISGVIGVNADPLTMLLQSSNIEVMGVTVVTGDGWLRQETADALRLLEMEGRGDIPVYMGAELPLVQSRYTLLRLTQLYGGSRTDPFLGAYGEFGPGPDDVQAPPGGFAKTTAQPGTAAEFMIRTIRANPHQISLYCGGALTNVALAISLAPDIVPLTKEIVFMGTSPEFQPKTVNVLYDPHAARIVLHAPWPKLTVFSVDVSEKVHRTPEMAEAIASGKNAPIAALYQERVVKPYKEGIQQQWFRMPDELMAAYLIDPSIVTEVRRFYVDVDLTEGMDYGASSYWDETPTGYNGVPWPSTPQAGRQKPVPPPDARVANVVWDFNTDRFKSLFVSLMTEPARAPLPKP
jgi:purine nucleosidase